MATGRFWLLPLFAVLALSVALYARELHSGRIIAVGTSSITLDDNRDKENDKIEVTAETKITRNGKPAKLSDLAVGDKAKVDATEVGAKLVAKSIEAYMPE